LAGDSINDTGTFIRKKIGWISWALFQRIQTVITLPDIERRLASYEAQLSPIRPSTRQAAVAIILRERDRSGTNVTDLLFIRRAEKSGDPWSGHMAFPGGHIESSDTSLLDAAIRETREEIGLDLLENGKHIGTIDHQRAQPRGRPLNMVIAPYVFRLEHETPFLPNHEVAEVVWTPLDPIAKGVNHTAEERVVNGSPVLFSGYRINGGHFVWGLTYRMMQSFFQAVDPKWEPPEQDGDQP
jgi:8-oxo-dGTP pyrophosphatase MutT (NUDIX family)